MPYVSARTMFDAAWSHRRVHHRGSFLRLRVTSNWDPGRREFSDP